MWCAIGNLVRLCWCIWLSLISCARCLFGDIVCNWYAVKVVDLLNKTSMIFNKWIRFYSVDCRIRFLWYSVYVQFFSFCCCSRYWSIPKKLRSSPVGRHMSQCRSYGLHDISLTCHDNSWGTQMSTLETRQFDFFSLGESWEIWSLSMFLTFVYSHIGFIKVLFIWNGIFQQYLPFF